MKAKIAVMAFQMFSWLTMVQHLKVKILMKKLFEHMSMTSSQRYPQQSDKVKCTFKIMNVKVSHFPIIKCSVLSLTVNHTTWKSKCLTDHYVLSGSDLVPIIEKNFWGSCHLFRGTHGTKTSAHEVLQLLP